MAPATGEREESIMKKNKNSDYDMPIGKLTRIKDDLPAPHELAMPDDTVKITILLNRESVDFFKHEARKHRTKYQKMIRELLDKYVSRYRAA